MATIRKRGERYQVQVRRVGHPKHNRSFITRKDAEAWARQTEVSLDQGDFKDRRQLKSYTLSDLISRYLVEVLPTKKQSTFKNETIILKAFRRHSICHKRLYDLNAQDFIAYQSLRLKTVQPSTLQRELNPVRHLLRIAKDQWGIPVPELITTKVPVSGGGRQRRAEGDELERLLCAALGQRNKLILSVIQFALETGARRSEILRTKASDIDLENRAWTIHETKNGHPRKIPLTLEAMRVLADRLQSTTPDRLVFPISPNALRLGWDRACKKAGVSDLNFHDLRHEAISRLFERGLTVPEVALISGHKDIRMLLRYGHGSLGRILKALDGNFP